MLLSSENEHIFLPALNLYFRRVCFKIEMEELSENDLKFWIGVRDQIKDILLEVYATNKIVEEQQGVDREIGENVDEHLFDWL